MSSIIKLALVALMICFLLLTGPWCFIWGINTLVAAGGVTTFNIPFTFWTWVAACLVGGLAILPAARRG
jgi:hypothetical protein